MKPSDNRAEALLYRLHNSGRSVSVTRMQRIAAIAKRAGSTAIMVLNYCDGNSNGRA